MPALRPAAVVAVWLLALCCSTAALAADAKAAVVPPKKSAVAKYVIQISVDGASPNYLQHLINDDQAPNFKRLQDEGASTTNARTDFDFTITLPNHTCMLTGRPTRDKRSSAGHGWTANGDPKSKDETLHSNAKAYVASTFDVAHDNGLRTALFASKSKFSIYKQSYAAANSAPDQVGDDNGRGKIDVSVINESSLAMTSQYVLSMLENPAHYSFVHFRNADSAGHAHGWGSSQYFAALRQVDGYLGILFDLIQESPKMRGKTTIILTADHGGSGKNHAIISNPLDYTIPFFVWGAGVERGADLYTINPDSRQDPRLKRPDYFAAGRQPIRNGDGANLALQLLGLGPVPQSLINSKQDLRVCSPIEVSIRRWYNLNLSE